MGGIAGIIRFDGENVADTDRSRVVERLKHRGTLRTQVVTNGVLMAFGSAIQTADTVYATADTDAFRTGLRPLFAEAYRRSGTRFLVELTGDFSLALWDENQQMLVLARDGLGAKPLYYRHQPGQFVAFASELKALLVLQDVIVQPNEHKYREYLTWVTDYVPYSAETFYEGIYSVLPGHSVQVTAPRADERPYWQINPSNYASLTDADAYATLFQEQFTDAVHRRMADQTRVGAHLSGGLDSSSVSCVAQSLLSQQQRPALHTFNIDTEQPEADEQVYVQAVRERWPVSHHRVYPVADVLGSVQKISALFDRPEQFIIPSSFHLSVSLAARQAGCDTLLTGHDGDSVATTGIDWLEQLVEAADWENLKMACQQFIGLSERDNSFLDINWQYLPDSVKFEKYALFQIGSSLAKRFREQPLPAFWSMIRVQKAALGLSTAAYIEYVSKRLVGRLTAKTLLSSALSDEFRQRVPMRPTRTTNGLATAQPEGLTMPLNQVINTTNVICNEQMNHIGAYYGHSYLSPFFDKSVVELCLATPLSVHFDQGRGRGLIRNGLKTVLPPAVRSRLTKANFVEYSTLAAQQLYQAARESISTPGHPIWRVVDPEKFARIVKTVFDPQLPVKKKTRFNWMLSRIIYLALWLDTLPGRQ